MKNFNNEQLRQLCREIRSDLIHTVSQTGGHLGASLGVVELTVALHKVHQNPNCYAHSCVPLQACTATGSLVGGSCRWGAVECDGQV